MSQGFGGKVIAFDIRENPAVVALGIPYMSKEEVLAQSDILSLHVPLLPSTYHIIDRTRCATTASARLPCGPAYTSCGSALLLLLCGLGSIPPVLTFRLIVGPDLCTFQV
jgi:hypothetical protein